MKWTPCSCSRGRRKSNQKRVALRVDVDAAMSCNGPAQDRPMIGKSLPVPIGSEVVQQPSRPLDVREEKGNGAGQSGRSNRPADRQITAIPIRYRYLQTLRPNSSNMR